MEDLERIKRERYKAMRKKLMEQPLADVPPVHGSWDERDVYLKKMLSGSDGVIKADSVYGLLGGMLRKERGNPETYNEFIDILQDRLSRNTVVEVPDSLGTRYPYFRTSLPSMGNPFKGR